MINPILLNGILGGSIATLLIKEIINQINKRQEFVRELKKHTYLKKLEKAENAIAFYWTYINKVTEIKKFLEFIIKASNHKDESEFDVEIIQKCMVKTGDILNELSGDKYSHINSIHLYFDLEDTENWNEKNIEELIESLSETKSIDNEILFWVDLYNDAFKSNNSKLAEAYWVKTEELLQVYINSLQKFINAIDENKNAIYKIICKIKKDFKLY